MITQNTDKISDHYVIIIDLYNNYKKKIDSRLCTEHG